MFDMFDMVSLEWPVIIRSNFLFSNKIASSGSNSDTERDMERERERERGREREREML